MKRGILWAGISLLILSTSQPTIPHQRTGVSSQPATEVPLALPCDPSPPEQPIPDDGHWLQVCLVDPMAPEDTTVTSLYLKYQIDHPDPNQLEVGLSRGNGGPEVMIWERGKAAKGVIWEEEKMADGMGFVKTEDLLAFHGTPSQGKWYLWIRDTVPGLSGWLKTVSLAITYAPTGPPLVLLSGEPGYPTALRLPPEAVLSPLDREKPESQEATPLAWQEVKRETFEGTFPSTGWRRVDANSSDNKEYLWGKDDYRPHWGYWAAWPARDGKDGYDPSANPRYPPGMKSWMIYGPFDLRMAKAADIRFYMWRYIEPRYDRLFFGISPDGVYFYYGQQWDGQGNWGEQWFRLNGYLGDDSVWVGWLFESDRTVEYEGPWVDDILIRKYVPGQVTVQGTLRYQDRSGDWTPARFTRAYLYDQDPGGTDDLLATTVTDWNGFFQFPAVLNWDEDDSSTDLSRRRLDLYVVWETDVNDTLTARRRVTDFGGRAYRFETDPRTDVDDGVVVFSRDMPTDGRQRAWWIFEDLRRAWAYIYHTTGIDPGSATVRWERDENCYTIVKPICNSFFWPYSPLNGIFIADEHTISSDTVIHELAHQYMYNVMGWWYWPPSNWDDFYRCAIQGHGFFTTSTALCAWTEGWADFLPLVVNGDECYDNRHGHCEPGWSENFETPGRGDNRPEGDVVEGRVAGALYDLYDSTNEGFDSAFFGFYPVAEIVFRAPDEETFSDFWMRWKSGWRNKHHAVRAIYQNTIDYDTSPRFEPPLPDRTVLQNFSWPHAIDLWAYAMDEESSDGEMEFRIDRVTDPRCGVSLEGNRWVNLNPVPGWLGSCEVTVRVSDTIRSAFDAFRVNVVPVRARVHLPLALKNAP